MFLALLASFWALHFVLKIVVLVVLFKALEFIVWKFSETSVQGRTVLITGGGAGIGRLTAIEFAKRGAALVLWDLNETGLAEAKAEIEALNVPCHTARVDVTDRARVYEAVREAKDAVGPIDILINNAGIVSGKSLIDEADGFSEKTMQVNTIAHFWTVKAVLPDMIKRNSGHIVTIASSAGLNGVSSLCSYCASKFGAVGFDEALRLEIRKRGWQISTTCVMPFYVATDLFKGAKGVPYLFLQIQDPFYVAFRICQAIRHREKQVYIPPVLKVLQIIKAIVPCGFADFLAETFGVSKSMDEFAGTGQDHHSKAAGKGPAPAAK